MKPIFVQTHTVIDPDSNLPVEIEIRKEPGGGMVGVDGSFLENTTDDVHSPFSGDKYDWPDDETITGMEMVATRPHYVLVNYGDGVEAGVYHYPNRLLAMQHIAGLLKQRNPQQEDDDGREYGERIVEELADPAPLCAANVNNALALYHEVPDNLETIEWGPINWQAEIPSHFV